MKPKQNFTQLIKQCCAAREWNLRKMLKRELPKHGFRIIEDDWKSRRGGKFDSVHNMLAIRGEPSVCLAAHTDVCRDHGWRSDVIPDVDPVIKEIETINGIRKIIQDRNCEVQVGGDDRLGVAIAIWIATHSNNDLAIALFSDEEIGCISSDYCSFNELSTYDLIVQIDRGNRSNQLVTNIGGQELCNEQTAKQLIQISNDIGIPRVEVNGLLTDVYTLRKNGIAKQAINMTCGYHNSYGAEPEEFIDLKEAEETILFVKGIISHYIGMKKLEQFETITENNDKEEQYNRICA